MKVVNYGSRLSRPIQDVVKMVNGGVPPEVLVAYVQNSSSVFNPTPENIIYLKDKGVPMTVITAMLVHDKTLRENVNQMPAPAVTGPQSPPQTPYDQYQPSYQNQTPGMPPAEIYPNSYNAQPQYDNNMPEQVNYFYNDLSPYGSWYSLPGYGWAWQPDLATSSSSWAPYRNDGRWLYSNYGWYWHSDYPWGWAPFHYGRWWNHPSQGWLWFPGTDWASSWVNWRCSPGFCGWAPLSPFTDPGFGLRAGLGADSFNRGFGKSGSANDFTFVPINRFTDPNVGAFRVNSTQARSLFTRSTLVNNMLTGGLGITANQGFDPDRVAAAGGSSVARVTVQDPPAGVDPIPDRVFNGDSAFFGFGGGFAGLGVFRARLQNGPVLSSAQAQTINPRFPQMRPGLLNTGQPTTAQSQEINPAFPNLRPGPDNPAARNRFFLAPFPSGASTFQDRFGRNQIGFFHGNAGTGVSGSTSTGPIPNFAPPGTVPGAIGPLPPFSPPGSVAGSGGPAVAPFSPPGSVTGSGGGRVAPFSPPGSAARGGGGAKGGGGGGGHR